MVYAHIHKNRRVTAIFGPVINLHAMKLFSPTTLGNLQLSNRVVMAPMTRSRAIENLPNELMANYYQQRSSAGLIITEGTAPSPNGLGYSRIPGLYNSDHVNGWSKITKAVHDSKSKIFVQIMHTGRIGHTLNLPKGAELLAPSSIAAPGQMYTDAEGLKDHPIPREMTKKDIQNAIDEFAKSAQLAIESGFDGVELHGANGYLIDQFLNPASNQRKDEYGGSPLNRMRFALEVTQAVSAKITPLRVGFRVSPHNSFNGLEADFTGVDEFYGQLSSELQKVGIVYLHSISPPAAANAVKLMRKNFSNSIILNGGYETKRAESDLQGGFADLIAFGRPFISNPNLVKKLQDGAPLATADPQLFYTPGEKGYTDYV